MGKTLTRDSQEKNWTREGEEKPNGRCCGEMPVERKTTGGGRGPPDIEVRSLARERVDRHFTCE